MHHRITHKSFCLALALVLLIGFTSPAMAVGCDCLCCGFMAQEHHENLPVEMNPGQKMPSEGPHGTGCNHCTLTPLDSPEAAVSPPSLLSRHMEKQVRLSAAVATPFLLLFDTYENDSEPILMRRSAPIYLQTLAIRR